MSSKPPKISVILPVYNAGSYLKAAITSILNQTATDFELIIINDGSTDDSGAVIASFSDPRIRVITQKNQGLRGALNVGLSESRGDFIARMDQDDISLPARFQLQLAFFETHPNHVLVGTTYGYINEQGAVTGAFPALLDNDEIKRELYTKSPFGHGTVMFRAEALKKGGYLYAQNAVHMEDYDLWFRFAPAGLYANLPEVLYLWRHSSTNTKSTHGDIQAKNARALQLDKISTTQTRELVRWPSWQTIKKYHNELATIEGVQVAICRKDAHCSLYLVLATLLIQTRDFLPACKALTYAFLISPKHLATATVRLLTHHS